MGIVLIEHRAGGHVHEHRAFSRLRQSSRPGAQRQQTKQRNADGGCQNPLHDNPSSPLLHFTPEVREI